jgi:hypothetical protein
MRERRMKHHLLISRQHPYIFHSLTYPIRVADITHSQRAYNLVFWNILFPWLLTRQPRLLSLSSEMLQLSPRDTGQHGRSEDGAS